MLAANGLGGAEVGFKICNRHLFPATMAEVDDVALPAAGLALALDTRTPGNYSYVLRDAAGLELNRIDYSVAGQGNVSR
jgi:hypothetical protein